MTINKRVKGFSLIEVVVAVGIFAIAIVSVIGLLGPINKSVAEVRDFDDASRVVSAIQSKLQTAGFTAVKTIMDGGTKVYASRDGNQVATASGWIGSNADKFFVVTLVRNEDLSKATNDDSAGYLAFTIKLRWPAFYTDGITYTEIQDGTNQAAQQSVMIVPAAITR